MKVNIAALLIGLCVGGQALAADAPQKGPVAGPVDTARYTTRYIRLPDRNEALLYEPVGGPKNPIALLFSHPGKNVFTDPIGPQMAMRGYRIIMVNYRGDGESDDYFLPAISDAISWLRTLPGVGKVVVIGHSGGGHLIPLYVNVAENGVSKACRGPEKLYPCDLDPARQFARPDGMILLDPTLGAVHQMSSIDPAITDTGRDPKLDMYAAANGYDQATGKATYSPEFRQRFFAAQAARVQQLIADAQAKVAAVESGKSRFSDDEPFLVRGMGVTSSGARPYQPDTTILTHSRAKRLLLRADGTEAETLITSVRPSAPPTSPATLASFDAMSRNTSARRFLAAAGVRTLPGYRFTEDDILGVDWNSSFSSTPGNAEGITVPSLVLTMGCHYLVVPGEIIFDHLRARDKSFAAVEGATHVFTPCRPQYGDTVARTFDYVDRWLTAGRF